MFRSRNKEMNAFLKVLPHIRGIINQDVMLALTDRERFIAYYPGDTMRIPQDISGAPIPKDDPIMVSLNTGEIQTSIVPESVYGFPFKSVTYPLIDSSGHVYGCIGFGKSLVTESLMLKSTESIMDKLLEAEEITSIISKDIDDISMDMESNSASIEEALAGTEEVTSKMEEVYGEVYKTKTYSCEMKSHAKNGSISVSEIDTVMSDIATSTDNVTALIKQLDKSVKEIESIVSIITGVSEQTNLLALNAAIEAARAGEQGKGFAVVADEVRKLAEMSKKSTIEISSLVESIERETLNVAEAVARTNEDVAHGKKLSKNIMGNFEEIMDSVDLVDNQVNEILDKTVYQKEVSREITIAIGSIAEATESTTLKTSRIRLEASNIAESVKSIAGDTEQIVKISSELFDSN